MTDSSRSIFPSAPVWVALAVVVLLIGAMVGLDVRLGGRVSVETDEIIDNTQRSLVLIDAIRTRAEEMTRFAVTESDRAALSREVDSLGRDYDPIATSTGESAEWTHLQQLLRRLDQTALDDHAAHRRLAKDINASADRLVAINVDEGRANAAQIRDDHATATRDDILAGALTIAIVTAISIVLVLSLQRQRRLVLEHVQTLTDKNRDLEAFAGRAAHDLRSPMNPIRGYADLLLESADSTQDVGVMARRIRTAVDRMARVVDDMLALSVAGQPPPGVAASSAVIDDVIDELGPELHGVAVTTTLHAGSIACSPGILNQLMRNLIGNALKYRDRTRPLTIAIETRDRDSSVEIAIQDNGVGMSPEVAAHAFEPMYRGHIDREVPGHGLGLAIVDRTTRALGGTCGLSSVLDHGTRITVRLPHA